jgi:hypothetical protein
MCSGVGNAWAAVRVQPVVQGYSNGFFKAVSNAGWSFVSAANDSHYLTQAKAWVSGREITMPAKLRIAANAPRYAVSAMRLHPLALVGTLALGWLLENGIRWDESTHEWTAPQTGWEIWWFEARPECGSCDSTDLGCLKNLVQASYLKHWFGSCNAQVDCHFQWGQGIYDGTPAWWVAFVGSACSGGQYAIRQKTGQAVGSRPATDEDFDNLPNPIPRIGPELPVAPYSPQGVPVEEPQYDFQPFTQPLGQPYLRPDGSTWQSYVSVSPDGDGVIVEVGDKKIKEPNGAPVQDPSSTYQPQPAPQVSPNPNPNPSQNPNPNSNPNAQPGGQPGSQPGSQPGGQPGGQPGNNDQGQGNGNSQQQQPEDFCQKHPDSLSCLPPGSLSDQVPKNSFSLNFSPEPVSLPSGCPQDIPVLGQSLSFGPACDAMVMLRPLLIGAASLVAGFIVVGAFKD